MKAINERTGKEVDIFFQQGDTKREWCFASDVEHEQLPNARTADYTFVNFANDPCNLKGQKAFECGEGLMAQMQEKCYIGLNSSIKDALADLLPDVLLAEAHRKVMSEKEDKMCSLVVNTLNKYAGENLDTTISSEELVRFITRNGYDLIQTNKFVTYSQPDFISEDLKTSLTLTEEWNLNHLILHDKKSGMAYTASGIVAPYSEIFREIGKKEMEK